MNDIKYIPNFWWPEWRENTHLTPCIFVFLQIVYNLNKIMFNNKSICKNFML